MTSSAVNFHAPTHTYTDEDGVILPSVTEICATLEVWQYQDDAAAEFGTHVHEAVALFLTGRLDVEALDPNLLPYVTAAQRFLSDCGAKVVDIERRVYSKRMRFAGTTDLFGSIAVLRRGTWRTHPLVLDWKTGLVTKIAGVQTAGYATALDELAALRWVVALLPNGPRGDPYKLTEFADPRDFTMFQSALNVWRFRNE